MSIKAMEWAASYPGLTRLERVLLKEIANRYNDEQGRAWPSQARLARETGYSRASVLRGLKTLVEKGLIVRINSYSSYSGARNSNRYFLPLYDPKNVPSSRSPIAVEQSFENGYSNPFDHQREDFSASPVTWAVGTALL